MASNIVSTYFKYANLQMAAEALYGEERTSSSDIVSAFKPLTIQALTDGNKHASKFPEALATQFIAEGWEIVAHQPNTTTGFSGTLFKNSQTGEYVLSFRSTEFIDDAVRDNQATNKMEIKEHGWAFGQIADMEAWWTQLKAEGKVTGPVTVTGYSLGGHLATAFNLMHPTEAAATYTFNGAGVGDVIKGKTLAQVISDFQRMRLNADGQQILFTDRGIQTIYGELREQLNTGNRPTEADIAMIESVSGSVSEKSLLLQALVNLRAVWGEVDRVAGLTDSKAAPVSVSPGNIAALNLDYQIAVLTAEKYTSSYRTGGLSSGYDAITNRNIRYIFPNCYDLYGANPPSGVANSQWHYGQPIPVFIEDQPLFRGNVIFDAAVQTLLYSDVKLLVNDYSNNDLGDTHSLVLIVDSLAVQNTLSTLDPAISTDTLNAILKAASAAKASSAVNQAEGDVLENTLNSLCKIIQGSTAPNDVVGNLAGNTWADINDRNAFYNNLRGLTESPSFKALIGKVNVTFSDATLADTARADFLSLLTLLTLSPIVLKPSAGNVTAVEDALKTHWADEYDAWKNDQLLTSEQRALGLGTYTDLYLADRAAMLGWVVKAQSENSAFDANNLSINAPVSQIGSSAWSFEDKASGKSLLLTPSDLLVINPDICKVTFGGQTADVVDGTQFNDHLYGMGGDDQVEGGAGNDWLEGNTGSDTLKGGKGRDFLLGGDGEDTYRYTTGDGFDTVIDSDGAGRILLDGVALTGGKALQPGGNVWQSDDGRFTYVAQGDLSQGATLIVNGTLALQNYRTGDLGIQLQDAPPAVQPVTPATNRDIVGDLAPVDFDPAQPGIQTREDALGNLITDPGSPQPGRDDVLKDSAGDDRIRAGGGNDRVYATRGGNDLVELGDGNDIAWLEDGDDWGRGEAGDDQIAGRDGRDTLEGGAGSDILLGEAGEDRLYADSIVALADALAQNATQAGNGLRGDWLSCGEGRDEAVGDAGNDVLTGGGGRDTLVGGGGDDLLLGDRESLPLPDWSVTREIVQQDGATMYRYSLNQANVWDSDAGDGDALYGGTGADWIISGAGDDFADGGADNDVLFGEAGDDTLLGNAGDDTVIGDSSGINIWGHGNDFLDGGDGNDVLQGEGGSDALFGGAGNDLLYADNVDENAGEDYLDGEDGDDTLCGGALADTIYGGAGNDILAGDYGTTAVDKQGGDHLTGEDGDDKLYGYGGADVLEGDAGNDTILGQEGDDRASGGDGDDLILGGEGSDFLAGDAGRDQLQGGNGDDTLDGGAEGDTLFGEAGNDTLLGGGSNDQLLGGIGDDVLDGGDGDDVYYYSRGDGKDHITDSGGTDWLVLSGISRWDIDLGVGSLKLTLPDGGEIHLDDFDPDHPLDGAIEYFQFADGSYMSREELIQTLGFKIEGTPGDDVLSGTAFDEPIHAYEGNDVVTARGGDDIIDLGAGDDQADAGDGADTVTAGEGADMVFGGDGNDTLDGGAGNDILAGGAGDDALLGGNGDDVYIFGRGDGQDVATDNGGANTIALDGLGADDVMLRRQGDDLIVSVAGATDRLTVRGWFADATAWIGIGEGDGSFLDRAAVQALLVTNQMPVTAGDAVALGEDGITAASGNVLANDADPEGRPLTVTDAGSRQGSYGSLVLSADGSFTYDLDNAAVQSLGAGQQVTDTFIYTAGDNDPAGAQTATGRLVATITGMNDAPVVTADGAQVSEDGVLQSNGNVLANDRDVDADTVLRVIDGGTRTGAYGSLTLGADGSYRYSLDNNSVAVQSLGRTQTVIETFGYTASDGIASVAGSLQVTVEGQNDAPVAVRPLADQSASPNRTWTYQIPVDSFLDPDQGDTLTWRATLADGTALPSWLTFDAATLTFTGRVPRTATGYLDIAVTATDAAAGTAVSTNLSVTDIFQLSFDGAAHGGGGGGGNGGHGGGSQGNEGVGNGEDPPPPGHDTSFNDGPGTGPGNPGARGGHVAPTIQEGVPLDVTAGNLTYAVGVVDGLALDAVSPPGASKGKAFHGENPGEAGENSFPQGYSGQPGQSAESLAERESAPNPNAAGAKDNGQEAGQACLDQWSSSSAAQGGPGSELSSIADQWWNQAAPPSGTEEDTAKRWRAMFLALAEKLDASHGKGGIGDDLAAQPYFQGLLAGGSQTAARGNADLSLMPRGQALKVFQGLAEGLERID